MKSSTKFPLLNARVCTRNEGTKKRETKKKRERVGRVLEPVPSTLPSFLAFYFSFLPVHINIYHSRSQSTATIVNISFDVLRALICEPLFMERKRDDYLIIIRLYITLRYEPSTCFSKVIAKQTVISEIFQTRCIVKRASISCHVIFLDSLKSILP